MVRNTLRLTSLMIALVALAGTATAAASLTGDLSGSAETEYASADVDSEYDLDTEGDMPSVTGYTLLGLDAQGHSVGASVDSDGNLGLNVDDHSATASIDIDGPYAGIDVDGHAVSTDDLPAEIPTAGLPALPGGSASVGAAFSVVISAIGGAMASLTGRFSALLGF